MPIPKKIINFLEKAKVKYKPIKHRTVYTAFDKAQTLKIQEKIIGKTLVVKLEKAPALVLIPADKNLDIQRLKKIAKVKKIDFIKEAWMKKNLKGVKIGAIPPFGNLWGFPTFADKTLLKEPKIIINAGDYNWSIKITSAVLKKLIPETSAELSRMPLVIGSFSKTRK